MYKDIQRHACSERGLRKSTLPPASAIRHSLTPECCTALTASRVLYCTHCLQSVVLHSLPPESAVLHSLPPESAVLHSLPPESAVLHSLPPESALLHSLPPESAVLRSLPPASAVLHSASIAQYETVDQSKHTMLSIVIN